MKRKVMKEHLKRMNKIMEDDSTQTENTPIRDMLIDFFQNLETSPADDQVHALADKLGIDPHALETAIYSLLYDSLNGLTLKNATVPDDKFDPKELEMGIKVEFEHIDDYRVAKAIAKAHLMEFPDYYTRLAAMEKQGKADREGGPGSKDYTKKFNERVKKKLGQR